MKEIWEDIPNYEGLYQASNLGRIRSVDRYKEVIIKNQYGEYKRTKFFKSYVLKQQTYMGYKCVQLHINGKYKWEKVHRLVAKAFVPNPENKPQVNHIDGNKSNNNVSNLKWTTFNSVMKEHHKNGVYKNNRSIRIKLIDDLNFNEIEFKSMAEAALYLQSIDPEKYKNIKTVQANIGSAVRNKRRAYGFKWEKISV